MDLPELYKKQISLSEWFENIGFRGSDKFREEDNSKRKRMIELSSIIDFPSDKPISFELIDVTEKHENFIKFLQEKGSELCALRLIPYDSSFPKLRMRGMTVKKVVEEWLPKQSVNPLDYQADFVPHPSDHLWSSILVVREEGVIGEIVKGSHNQLTQGFFDEGERPYQFFYNFKDEIKVYPENSEVRKHAEKILGYLFVEELEKQNILKERFGSEFFDNYLGGYFETVESVEYGLWFIDYNRLLHKTFKGLNFPVLQDKQELDKNVFRGTMASPGKAIGFARLVSNDDLDKNIFDNGEILVCNMTTPAYLPFMKKAAAILTNEGGILSHAAIISRELGIPSVVGVSGLLDNIKDGDKIEVDADKGKVFITQSRPITMLKKS